MKREGNIMPIDPKMNYKLNLKVLTIRIKSDELDDDDARSLVLTIFGIVVEEHEFASFEFEIGEE
jgi:hypothetical protein